MTAPLTSAGATAAELEAARLLLARMGILPAELVHAAASRPPAPTFAEYIPIVSAAVSAGTRRVYGSYWNRIVDQWGQRRLDSSTQTTDTSSPEATRKTSPWAGPTATCQTRNNTSPPTRSTSPVTTSTCST
jgi:hypothetical protein